MEIHLKFTFGGIEGGNYSQSSFNINLGNINVDISGENIENYYIGGIKGGRDYKLGKMNSNLNLGNIQSKISNNVGGILGGITNDDEIPENCYFLKNDQINTNLKAIGNSDQEIGGIKANKSDFLTTTFLVDTLGFDTSIWKIENNKIPEIR